MSVKISLRDRVVVTGIGVVSPIGCNTLQFWNSLMAPSPTEHAGAADFTGQISDFGEVTAQTKRLIRKSIKLMNRETQLGVAAAQHAITGSGLHEAGYEPDRIGVCFGAGNVEIQRADFVAGVDACAALKQFDPSIWGELGIPHIDPLWILRVLPNMPACHCAIANDLRGPNNTITHAEVATNMAVAEARNAILDGDADAMVVGGTGTNLLETPTDQSSSEVMPSEAAAAFVIERLDAALQRNATIYGEILATSSATVIEFDHRARPSDAGISAFNSALNSARIDSTSIRFVSTELNSDALCPNVRGVNPENLVSIKERTGDAAAGSSAMEIAASLLALYTGQSPATRTVNNTHQTIAININTMASGLASCVVMRKLEQPVAA